MRNYIPIEDYCDYWDEARPFIVASLPPVLRLIPIGALLAPDIRFITNILRSVPDLHAPTIRALRIRFDWVARYLPNTLPTAVEFSHLLYENCDSRLLLLAEQVLRSNDAVRVELGLPTSMQLVKHALGVTRCPVPIDLDWQ